MSDPRPAPTSEPGNTVDYRLLFEESSDDLLVLLPDDPEYTVVAATRGRLHDAPTDWQQAVGRGLFEFFTDSTQGSGLRASLERVLKTRRPDTMAVRKELRGALRPRYWKPRNIPVLSSEGEVRYILHRVEEVTDVVRADELAAEVERSTRELDALSYSISHDLRAPLRAVSGFSHAVLESSVDRLDDESKRWLENVRSGCRRMGEMIDGLLHLARVTRCDFHREDVDLGALVQDVVENLRRSEPGRSVEMVVAGGLRADADPRLLRSVLENLLGNAWKFTRKSPRPVVEFGAVGSTYFVRDNGAGFRPASAGRLFAPFQRLHPESDFEGIGIGLATVQRIIHRHGGRIWAEGDVGKGATFSFTLAMNRELEA